ncbi:hypothetical protein AWC38_SpisGene1217 [Stylophora pistillata]|uniref:YqaJ viral recombinase domain-containing protein n=1 Tax=Stylophora pistillata TaxID=50429 RepID=A0A2B4SZM8_STYPI|nr:hypothetical protein AWC38_SpisGene1217 [Stylophora pistillata]
MFPAPKKYSALSRKPTQADRSALYEDLKEYGRFTGLCCLISPERPVANQLPFPTIEEIIFSDEFLQATGRQQQQDCLVRLSRLQETDILRVSELTAGLRDNPAWLLARRGRLTASNFGSVLKAKRLTPSLVKHLLGEYYLSRVKAVQWGVNNEEEAVKAFTLKTGLAVKETGIWFYSSGILCASPDGITDEETVLEVKCPYTERNLTIVEAVVSATFFPEKCRSRQGYALKKDYVRWHQVQGEMYFSKKLLTNEEFLFLYEANKPLNLELPYYEYEEFNLEENIGEAECKAEFRFERGDIECLADVLQLPPTFECPERSVCDRIEGPCILLRRLAYPCRYSDMVSRRNGPICRLGENQRMVYNGQKRVHALKFQAVSLPNGLTGQTFRAVEGKKHAAAMLADSDLLTAPEQYAVSPTGRAMCIYEDPAYPLRVNLMAPFRGAALTAQMEAFNKSMSNVQTSVEWLFGDIAEYFKFIDFKKNLKVHLHPKNFFRLTK